MILRVSCRLEFPSLAYGIAHLGLLFAVPDLVHLSLSLPPRIFSCSGFPTLVYGLAQLNILPLMPDPSHSGSSLFSRSWIHLGLPTPAYGMVCSRSSLPLPDLLHLGLSSSPQTPAWSDVPLTVFRLCRLGLPSSALNSIHAGFLLFARVHACLGFAPPAYGIMCAGTPLAVPDYIHPNPFLPSQTPIRPGSPTVASGMSWLDSMSPLLDCASTGSALPSRTPCRVESALPVYGMACPEFTLLLPNSILARPPLPPRSYS